MKAGTILCIEIILMRAPIDPTAALSRSFPGRSWLQVKAADIFAMLKSFLKKGQQLKRVIVYPSDYGLQRMAEEARFGPRGLAVSQGDAEETVPKRSVTQKGQRRGQKSVLSHEEREAILETLNEQSSEDDAVDAALSGDEGGLHTLSLHIQSSWEPCYSATPWVCWTSTDIKFSHQIAWDACIFLDQMTWRRLGIVFKASQPSIVITSRIRSWWLQWQWRRRRRRRRRRLLWKGERGGDRR